MLKIRTVLAIAALTAVATAALAATGSARPRAERNIVGTAVASGQFTTLTKLLTRTGLVSTLRGPGPFTVFAPTDAAFARVPASTLAALSSDRAKLKAVLLYHVVAGKVTAADAMKLRSATTVEGARVRIRSTGAGVFVNGAKVVKPDVMATNGVIHVINRVLIPPAR
jgi:uncharacterized surface protein with fasciclin (FAS1) repeats